MPTLTIKDVPEDLARALRERAARNHRSLQGELMAIIEAAAGASRNGAATPEDWRRQLAAQGIQVLHQGWCKVEDLGLAPSRATPASSAAIIREMRDTHYGEAWIDARSKDGHSPAQETDSPALGDTVYCVIPQRPSPK